MLFKDFLEYWYKNCCLTKLSPTTYESYRRNLDNYIIKCLGSYKLSDLKPLHLQSFYTECQNAGLANKTIVYFHRIIHSSLHQAQKWQFIYNNIADCVEIPKVDKYIPNVLDSTQISKLYQCAKKTNLYIPIMIAISTGMWRGEVLGLTWDNVDLEKGTISVLQTLYPTQNGLIILPPKTKSSIKTITITKTLIDILHEHRIKQNKIKKILDIQYINNNLVCCKSNGEALNPSTFNHNFKDF